MKYVVALTALLFIGCNNSQTDAVNSNEYTTIDSLVGKSLESIVSVDNANKKSDSLVTGKIDKTVKKIQKLETEIKELKEENNELKNLLDASDDNGNPYTIRTISDYQDY